MNKKKQTINPTEVEKETPEISQSSNTTTTASDTLPHEDKTLEETSTESLKDLQKEVAEKEQQINQQLEILWASGTKQMFSDHTTPFIASTEQGTTPPITQQKSAPLEPRELPVVPIKQHIKQETTIEKQQNLTAEHGAHELIPVEEKIEKTEKVKEKIKKTTKKKNDSTTKKKKEST